MAASQPSQFFGQGEGEEKVAGGQEQVMLFLQPQLSLIVLALGTVAVAARVILILGFTAILAGIEVAAKRKSATSLDGAHHLAVTGQHLVTIRGAIVGTVEVKDLGHLYHGTSSLAGKGVALRSMGLITRSMASVARVSALRVKWA